jgi:hypothetical protein
MSRRSIRRCGTATWAWKRGSYCPSNNWIHLDCRGLQSYITFGFGDYVAGGLVALLDGEDCGR